MRVALIGLGGIGGLHLKVYQSMNDVSVVAVADVEAKTSEKIKGSGIRFYASMDELLKNEKIDMVDICTPTYLHAEQAIFAMERGHHVLCEKPMALKIDQAIAMADAALKNKVFFMTAQAMRFWPEYQYLKIVFDENKYGMLRQLFLTRICSRPRWSWQNWMMDGEKSGRGPLDLHIHDSDYIYYLLGSPMAVRSYGIENGESMSYITTKYDYIDKIVIADGGWYDAKIPFTMNYRAVFDNAVLDFKNYQLFLYEINKEAKQIKLEDTHNISSETNINYINAYNNEIRYFIECIKNKQYPEISSPESTVESLKLVYKELESIRNGKEVLI